ncbi:helix-turn-helix transcriptional regulator [Rhodococcus phenolicus]|uniref:helix-turn-helix transcriptional regulator n=1 Tax=Rhodococcus phenolicus TaxID=263849 RepID=UPI0008363F30|nr:helix-turn-helix domain-containing protein [Rhodococcus phenolicus]
MSEALAPAARTPLPGRKEVAAYLGMTENGLAQLHYRGDGPPQIKIGGRAVRYRWEDVDAWLETRRVSEASA